MSSFLSFSLSFLDNFGQIFGRRPLRGSRTPVLEILDLPLKKHATDIHYFLSCEIGIFITKQTTTISSWVIFKRNSRLKSSFPIFRNFLPNPDRILPVLTYNGLQPLNANAGRILPGFGRKIMKYRKTRLSRQKMSKFSTFSRKYSISVSIMTQMKCQKEIEFVNLHILGNIVNKPISHDLKLPFYSFVTKFSKLQTPQVPQLNVS